MIEREELDLENLMICARNELPHPLWRMHFLSKVPLICCSVRRQQRCEALVPPL